MNQQLPAPTPAAILNGAPVWLTVPFVLIGIAVICGLLILWWGTHLANRRRRMRAELEDRGEAHYDGDPPDPATMAPPSPAEAAPAVAEQIPLADEPIAAAAAFDASPAALAASEPAPALAADDLTRLKGVGPRLAEKLQSVGITSFAQLAALSPAEADALDAQLGSFQGRIHRDRWIEQAGYLASGDTAGYEAVFGKL
ncbi:helix-hairpin-helix domain-containing protein [Sphingomonas sp. M1-B02]|uniref:helix-hairpin-helix domain-containing protein n=1 Tax=Sphingomonas sp. M1-B02 TaxID=3114300 RepID=UPI00223FE9E3|nr:helix-hairpin-helix domain-containing protein [Sphingomonas sp. S6-11]UZK65735.1 hypothetical protein OKW87_14655 [Sphingomonas sp. S6-11]